MASFEFTYKGETYDVEAPDAETAVRSFNTAMGMAAPGSNEPEKDTSFFSALRHGAAEQIGGVGNTADKLTGLGKGAEQFADGALAAPNYDPAAPKVGLNPATWGHVPRAVVESLPALAVDLGAGALGALGGGVVGGPVGAAVGGYGGYAASHAARNYGKKLDTRMAVDGKSADQATTGDKLAVLGTDVAQAGLERFGLKGLGPATGRIGKGAVGDGVGNSIARGFQGGAIDSVTGGAGAAALAQLPGQVVGAAGREALTAGAGNLVDQFGRTAGTDKGLSISADELANAAALGGATGGAIRAVRGAGDVVQSTNMRTLMADKDRATRVANDLDAVGADLSKPEGAGSALNLVSKTYNRELNEAKSPFSGKKAAQADRELVNDTIDRIKDPKADASAHIADVEARLGNTPEGARLVEAMKNLNTLQSVKALGSWSKGAEFGNPGLSGRAANAVKRVANVPGAQFTGGGLSAAGIMSAGLVPSLMAAAPYVAGAGAAMGGLRAIDGVTGVRQPLAQFVKRFGDGGAALAGPLPNASPFASGGPQNGPQGPQGPQGGPMPGPGPQARPGGPGQGQPGGGPAPQPGPTYWPFTEVGPNPPAPVIPAALLPAPARAIEPPTRGAGARIEAHPEAPKAAPTVENPVTRAVQEGTRTAPEEATRASRSTGPAPEAISPMARAMASAPRAEAPKTPSIGDLVAQAKGSGMVSYKGIDFPVPEHIAAGKSARGYVSSIKMRQDRIINSFERIMNNFPLSKEAKIVVATALPDMRTARVADHARRVKQSILDAVPDKASRDFIDNHFNDQFFSQWNKKSREGDGSNK